MTKLPDTPPNGSSGEAAPISAHVQARILAEALPNMLRYDEQTVVVKFGAMPWGTQPSRPPSPKTSSI